MEKDNIKRQIVESSRIAQPVGTTLDQFVRNNPSHFRYPCAELCQLMQDIVLAAKVVSREINKAGLMDITGAAGSANMSGEQQYRLDILANTAFERALKRSGQVCALVSEEYESLVCLNDSGSYVVALDPIDGSSNIDVDVSIGTIFSVYHRTSPAGTSAGAADALQKGAAQLVAGYILYGSSTMLVYTSGHGVNGFTYEPGLGEYLLSHPAIQMPCTGAVYSINEGISNLFPPEIKTYLEHCKRKQYTSRYIGSFVADFHRNLLKGGIYLYPGTRQDPTGKLRLVFECNALAFVAEQAGGKAIDGDTRILDLQPKTLHQRTSLYVGSAAMVDELARHLVRLPRSPQTD